MTHELGSQYRVRIVHEDETEELSEWMTGQAEVAQVISARRGAPIKAYWLQVRNVLCLDCLHREPTIAEFPLAVNAAENSRVPQRTASRLLGSCSSRTFSAGS